MIGEEKKCSDLQIYSRAVDLFFPSKMKILSGKVRKWVLS